MGSQSIIFELLLVMALYAGISTLVVHGNLDQFNEHLLQKNTLLAIYQARTLGLKNHKSTQITCDPTHIFLKTNTTTTTIPTSKSTPKLNVSHLGFTELGNTAKSGTLTIGTLKITLPVGFGKPRLK